MGWHTAYCPKLMKVVPGQPLVCATPHNQVVIPEVLIVRPIRDFRLSFVEAAHAAGQRVFADLDDDLWGHEAEFTQAELEGQRDYHSEWFPHVDGVLVSTEILAGIVREKVECPVVVAPNCYDTFGLGKANPGPGRNLGTRLWIGARQSGDLELYDRLICPLLDSLNLKFVHIGAGSPANYGDGPKGSGRLGKDRAWPQQRLIEVPTTDLLQIHKPLSHISVGTICISDQRYNLSKTETHAVELASAGLPLVAATNHPLYINSVPGRVDPTPEAVAERVDSLVNCSAGHWRRESARAREWARKVAVRSERQYVDALLSLLHQTESPAPRTDAVTSTL